MTPPPSPVEHKRDRKHKDEPQWVEIAYGHIVLRFLKAIRGVREKKPRKNLEPKRFHGRSATYVHSLHGYNECCEMARRILCPELYRHWLDTVEENHPVLETPPIFPQPTPESEPLKAPVQGKLFD